MVFARFAVRGIGVVSTMILARLLLPADFGLVALATMLVAAVEIMAEFNFDLWLIRHADAERRHYDTVWTLSVLRGLVMGGIIIALAGPAASFFDDPRLYTIILVLSAITIAEGLKNVGVVDFQKELQFDKDFALMFWPKLAGFGVVVTCAFLLRSYWALVFGTLVARGMHVLLSFVMHPYRPRPSMSEWREVIGFSKWLLLNNVIGFAYLRADTFFLGKLAGAGVVGLYSVAYEISNLATTQLVAPIRRAIYPGYARMAGDPESIRKGYVDVLALTLALALPIAAGIGLVADPLVRVALGQNWLDAVPVIRILTLYGIFSLTWSNMAPAIIAIGRPQTLCWFLGVGILTLIPLLYFGVRDLGAIGAAWAVTIANGVLLVIGLALVVRALSLPFSRLIVNTWRPFVSCGAMAAVVIAIQAAWTGDGAFPTELARLFVCSAVGACVYVGALLSLWRLCNAPDGAERMILLTGRSAAVRIWNRAPA